MTYLSEDPTYLAGGLLLLAGAFVISLKITQQGKYLLRAGVALALAFAVIFIEWMWVTDNERIEKVVHDLRTAVLNSDLEGILTHLTPAARYSEPESSLTPDDTRSFIRARVSNLHLDFVRISSLKTSIGQQTHRSTAEFRVFTSGGLETT